MCKCRVSQIVETILSPDTTHLRIKRPGEVKSEVIEKEEILSNVDLASILTVCPRCGHPLSEGQRRKVMYSLRRRLKD
ncbi:hypothetical protein B6U74_01810 [Candidatus Bathyarchaeota archaeon ex4484_205]|nr:MAG: hypothetical protein B6U74_01810 [Candidatus Bathyarchaeota archaeon ex4484_205]